jgi:hypothetical protein
MGDSYHLDHEMTKQELQMENRRLRNHLRRILEIATHLDIALSGTNRAIHFQCDAILYEINQACVARFFSRRSTRSASTLLDPANEETATPKRIPIATPVLLRKVSFAIGPS